MNRRSFFARVGGGAVAAVLAFQATPPPAQVTARHLSPYREGWRDAAGRRFRYVTVPTGVYQGLLCMSGRGQILGVAMEDISPGRSGWIQIEGPTSVACVHTVGLDKPNGS